MPLVLSRPRPQNCQCDEAVSNWVIPVDTAHEMGYFDRPMGAINWPNAAGSTFRSTNHTDCYDSLPPCCHSCPSQHALGLVCYSWLKIIIAVRMSG